MKEIKCTIIQDVLPLYIDEVVSQDTKEMVDQHLQHCEKCQKEYETMKRELYIPAENKAPTINKINKKWRKKKVIISFASIFSFLSLYLSTRSFHLSESSELFFLFSIPHSSVNIFPK